MMRSPLHRRRRTGSVVAWLVARPAAAAICCVLAGCNPNADRSQRDRIPSLHVAEAALGSGAPDVALRVADLILAQQPTNAAALTARGDGLYALGQRTKAQQAYRAALDQDASSVPARIGLGRTLARFDPAAAEAAFLAALTYEPDNVVALNDLGVARDLLGHNVAAQDAYRHALAISPDSADVQINLGLSLAVAGDRPGAMQVLRAAAAMPGAAGSYHRELITAINLAGGHLGAGNAPLSQSAAVKTASEPGAVSAALSAGLSPTGAIAAARPAFNPAIPVVDGGAGITVALSDHVAAAGCPVAHASAATAATPAKAAVMRSLERASAAGCTVWRPPGEEPRRAQVAVAPAVLPAAPVFAAGTHVVESAPTGTAWPTSELLPDNPAPAAPRPDIRMRVANEEPGSLAKPLQPATYAGLVQGMYGTHQDAVGNRISLAQLDASLLIDRQSSVTLTMLNGRPAWRLSAGGLADRADAAHFCGALRLVRRECLPSIEG